jgi:hypothetical protein
MIFTAIGTAIGSAGLAGLGAGVGMLGQAVMGRKSAIEQEKQARVANRRERLKQLASMRQKQRANEFVGVVSGTSGSSSQAGQSGSIASQAAERIGTSVREQSGANRLSSINNMATGFGVLQQIGQTGMQMPSKVKDKSGVFNTQG